MRTEEVTCRKKSPEIQGIKFKNEIELCHANVGEYIDYESKLVPVFGVVLALLSGDM